MLLRITSAYFCAGYDTSLNAIAPIIAYMRGWPLDKIRSYCHRRNFVLEEIRPDGTTHAL